jgi:hypothetical protein
MAKRTVDNSEVNLAYCQPSVTRSSGIDIARNRSPAETSNVESEIIITKSESIPGERLLERKLRSLVKCRTPTAITGRMKAQGLTRAKKLGESSAARKIALPSRANDCPQVAARIKVSLGRDLDWVCICLLASTVVSDVDLGTAWQPRHLHCWKG